MWSLQVLLWRGLNPGPEGSASQKNISSSGYMILGQCRRKLFLETLFEAVSNFSLARKGGHIFVISQIQSSWGHLWPHPHPCLSHTSRMQHGPCLCYVTRQGPKGSSLSPLANTQGTFSKSSWVQAWRRLLRFGQEQSQVWLPPKSSLLSPCFYCPLHQAWPSAYSSLWDLQCLRLVIRPVCLNCCLREF